MTKRGLGACFGSAVLVLMLLPSANASLIGLSVDGSITAGSNFDLIEQFISPQTISAGEEFSGRIYDLSFDDFFNVSADLTSDALLLTVAYDDIAVAGATGEAFSASFVSWINPTSPASLPMLQIQEEVYQDQAFPVIQ